MDGRPGAGAAHADAIGTAQVLLHLGDGLDHFGQVVGGLDAGLLVHLPVVGDRVELETPGNAPLLGVRRAQRAAGHAVPGGRGAQSGLDVLPVILRVGLLRVLDEFVEVVDPTRRAVGPGHVGAGHEGVVLRRLRGQRRGHLVEIDVFREDVIGHVQARHRLEVGEVGDHRIRIGMFVQQQVKLAAVELLPVEVGGQGARSGRVEHEIRSCGRDAELSGARHQFAAADPTRLEGVKEVLCFF